MSRPLAAGVIWSDEIPSGTEGSPDWIWEGFIAPGNVTLLTSQWKSGKTTLLAVLLGLRVAGGELGGLAVRPGKTVVISEEPMPLWAQRIRRHRLAGNVCFLPQPFRSIPTQEEWRGLIERVLEIHRVHGVDLVVIDPLAPFLRSENQARGMLETLLALGDLQRAGMAVLLLHHPGRGERLPGQAARGSGALLGHVDVSIEMRLPAGDPLTRRRRLFTLSRYPQTPRLLTLELGEAGTTYTLVPESAEERFEVDWEPIRLVLAAAPRELTRQDILQDWPSGFERPTAISVWRRLDRAVEQGLVRREGNGRKGDPFRYTLPQREEFPRPPAGSAETPPAGNTRCLARTLVRPDPISGASPPPEAPLMGNEGPTAGPPVAGVQAKVMPLEPVPAPDASPETAASATPGLVPPQVVQPAAPEAPVRLPYPFSIMNPADVPEEVWKKARAGQEGTL